MHFIPLSFSVLFLPRIFMNSGNFDLRVVGQSGFFVGQEVEVKGESAECFQECVV